MNQILFCFSCFRKVEVLLRTIHLKGQACDYLQGYRKGIVSQARHDHSNTALFKDTIAFNLESMLATFACSHS